MMDYPTLRETRYGDTPLSPMEEGYEDVPRAEADPFEQQAQRRGRVRANGRLVAAAVCRKRGSGQRRLAGN